MSKIDKRMEEQVVFLRANDKNFEARKMGRILEVEEFFNNIEQNNYPYKNIVNVFRELIERNAAYEQNASQLISIDIGKRTKKGFGVYLHTAFENPKVLIEHFGNEPQLRISSCDKLNGGSVILNLTMIDNIVIKENCDGDTFLTYDVIFHYCPANMDYKIHIVVRN